MKNKHEQIVRGGIQDRILMGKRAVADTGERSPLCVRRFSVALAACFAVAGASCVKVGLDRRSGEETPSVPLISTPVVESPEVGDRTFREVGGTSRDEEETRPPVLVSRITEDHVGSQIDVPLARGREGPTEEPRQHALSQKAPSSSGGGGGPRALGGGSTDALAPAVWAAEPAMALQMHREGVRDMDRRLIYPPYPPPPPHRPHHPPYYPWPYSPPPHPVPDRESYDDIEDNPFVGVSQNPLSTFSIDVDTASYANVRRYLNSGRLPPRGAVRIEELINYFPYEKAMEKEPGHPLVLRAEIAPAPWDPDHLLLRVLLRAEEIPWRERAAGNLVFLIDVSGSMRHANKLPLVKSSLEMLVRRLDERDRVAIVTYAGNSRIALTPTTVDNREVILHAIRALRAGGATHASAGIEDAYRLAEQYLVRGGNNRVVLCSDGDFNVGVTDRGSLVRMIGDKARRGIFLTVLGFGMGNLKDGTLEELSNRGDGNYAYIDSLREGHRVFVERVGGTMLTVAKDTKIQIEFNSARVSAYRLIGYENRRLVAWEFNDDRKDAGEVGAGDSVTALYEIVPVGVDGGVAWIDPLNYQPDPVREKAPVAPAGHEWLTVKVRYKPNGIDRSVRMELPVVSARSEFEETTDDFRFSVAVALFGMILRDSPYCGEASMRLAGDIARGAQGRNQGGYRSEFLFLVDQAAMLFGEDNTVRMRESISKLGEYRR